MNIVTLYENNDLAMRKSLDRYLSQLARGGDTHIWNDEMVLPGEKTEVILQEHLKNADLVLLLVSQDFWASETCYAQAVQVLEMSQKNSKKKIVNVLLRPNSLEDTPFKDLPQLPAPNVCVTQYRDPEQGYWDIYQGLKKIIDPSYRYKKRPKVAALQTTVFGSAVLLLWSLFVLLLPVMLPENSIKIASEPFAGKFDSIIFYKIYKLDHTVQREIALAFVLENAESQKLGDAKPVWATLEKTGDEDWAGPKQRAYTMQDSAVNYTAEYSCQCVHADFEKNEAGEYHFVVEFDKALDKQHLEVLKNKLSCSSRPCGWSESNCPGDTEFSAFHRLYFQDTRFFFQILVFVLFTLLLASIFITKKISSYAKSDSHSNHVQQKTL